MRFLFIYHGGDVPKDEVDQNIADLWSWLDRLKEKGHEKGRFAGKGRNIVSQHAVNDYSGEVFGISIVEAETLEEAVSLTKDWPEMQYGGRIEILEAI